MKMELRITIYHFCRKLRIRQNPDVNIIRTAVRKLFTRTLTLSHFFNLWSWFNLNHTTIN